MSRTALPLLIALLLTGCRQQMASQPAYRPLVPSAFFDDQRSARPLVAGTVPRGELEIGPYWTGRKAMDDKSAGEATVDAEYASYLDVLPLAPDKLGEAIRRGRERYDIYCSVCHDRTGHGKGMIVQRGFTHPPDLHTDLSRGFQIKQKKVRLRDAPVGYFFEVVTNGYGAMPSYRKQIPPPDRWAIVAYVKVLQASQDYRFDDVQDAATRRTLAEMRGKKE